MSGYVPLVLALLLGAHPLQDARLPVPESAALKQAEKLVREVLKEDYARKDPPSRRALGQKLLSQAETSKDDTANCFVLLSDARDIAAETGDLKVAMTACDRLADTFQVDRVAVRRACLDKLRKPVTPEESALLTEAFFRLIDEATAAENFEAALAASRDAEQAAQKAKQLPLLSKAKARGREIAGLRAEFQRAEGARKKLEAQPDDAESNFVLGRFLVLIKGDWDSGLALLAKGSNPAWKDAAARDLKIPLENSEHIALGDAWWELGTKEEGSAKARLWARAAHYYQRALPEISGLQRVKLEKRLEELSQSGAAAPASGGGAASGPAAWWRFDEKTGSSARDAIGKDNLLVLSNGATWGEGRTGGALVLDGRGARATAGDAGFLNVDRDSFSVALFIKLGGMASYRVVNKWEVSAPPHGWVLDANTGASIGGAAPPPTPGAVRVKMSDGGGGMVDHIVDAGLSVGAWKHVAFTADFKGDGLKIYIDGNQLGKAQSLSGFSGSLNTTTPLSVGMLPGGQVTLNYFNGSIDDLRFYRRVLSADEVRELATRK